MGTFCRTAAVHNVSAAHQETCETFLSAGGCSEPASTKHSTGTAFNPRRSVSGKWTQTKQTRSSLLSSQYMFLCLWGHYALPVSLHAGKSPRRGVHGRLASHCF